MGALNGFIGTTIFVPGLNFGEVASKYTIMENCTAMKQCSQR